MIIILERVIAFTILSVLVFNMTQRRHLEGGEAKRMASLLLGGVLIFLYGGIFVLKQNAFGLSAIGPAFFFPSGRQPSFCSWPCGGRS